MRLAATPSNFEKSHVTFVGTWRLKVEHGSGENAGEIAGECRSDQESSFWRGIRSLRGKRRGGERVGEWRRIGCACSNVASGPTVAGLLEIIDDAIAALDAGEIDIA
jgi:hypothetical protein